MVHLPLHSVFAWSAVFTFVPVKNHLVIPELVLLVIPQSLRRSALRAQFLHRYAEFRTPGSWHASCLVRVLMSKPAGSFQMRVEHVDGYEFRVRFDKPEYPDLLLDEPPPLGRDRGPNPARVLAASIAGCLSASLLFCLNRAKVPVSGVNSDVRVELVRNDSNRLRIGSIGVCLHPKLGADAAYGKCIENFEDFCVVTQSVREGVKVDVTVEPEIASR